MHSLSPRHLHRDHLPSTPFPWCLKMPRKHKKVSFSTPVASPRIATQNSFSLLSPIASTTGLNSPPKDTSISSPSGFTPPPKKRRKGPPLLPPDMGVSSEKPKGKLETKIHTLAQQ